MNLDAVFELPNAERFHHGRAERIRALLAGDAPAPGAPDDLVADALAHHFLEGGERAARGNDPEAFAWYRSAPRRRHEEYLVMTAAGERLVLNPAPDEMMETEISDTPICLLGPGSRPPSDPARDLVAAAVGVGVDAGFGALLHGSAPVIALLARRNLGDVLTSWSITRLPGTVFVDHVGDSAVLARDLIHEAGHNWLNGALAAFEVKIPDNVTFHSPWKRKHRPAFGFVHACWAFPLTMIFVGQVLSRVQGEVAAYLTAYLDKQRPLLAAAEADHPRSLELIDEPDLRSRLASVFAMARAL